jgi:hypothetical protein
LLVVVLVFLVGMVAPLLPVSVLFGWVPFLGRVLPELTVSWSGVGTVAVCVLLLLVGLHLFCGWVSRRRQLGAAPGTVPGGRWRFLWTACILGIVVLMFTAGIAAVGVVHQTAWVMSSPEPLTLGTGSDRIPSYSKNNLRQIGVAMEDFVSREGGLLPSGCTTDARGVLLHGWQAQMLPYLEQDNLWKMINFQLSWDHPANAQAMKTRVETYLHPSHPLTDADGYFLSHYAANVHVLGGDVQRTPTEAAGERGASNTILAGEAAGNFKPWGYPANWRDPADGLDRSPDGFGSYSPFRPTQLLMLDDSVRSFRRDTDPEFLGLLSKPSR